jgi:hypothetical protein
VFRSTSGRERRVRPSIGSKQRGGERGQGLIIFALGLSIFLAFTALTTDVGLILHERRELQKTADAAALAGAQELPESQVLAASNAQDWAERNGIDFSEGDDVQITLAADHTSVNVEVTREASFFFGRVIGLTTVDVHASATAKVGSPAALSGVLPFGVLESAINYDGTPTTIKYDANQPTNGNFGPIRIDGGGSNIHEQTIINGSQGAVCGISQASCADATVDTQTGNMVGATRDGFNYLLDNTSEECDEFDEVLIPNDDGRYNVNGPCNPFLGSTDSHRLILVPVIDSFCNGNCEVEIQYFVAMFLNTLENCTGVDCTVTGTFVKTVADPANDAVLGTYDEDSGIKFVRLVE